MGKFLKISGTFLSVILCTVFVLLAVSVPFYYSITGLTKPKTVTEIVQSVDYKTVIKKTPVLESALKQNGIDGEKADKFMKSEQASQLIEVYTDEATEILLNVPKDRMFDVELIKEIAEENIDELVKIAEENTGKNYSEKKIKKNVDTFIKKNEKQIEEVIPVIETTRKVVKTIHESKVIEQQLSLKTALILSAVAGVILIGVFFMKKIGGCIWIGITCLISSVIQAMILIFSQSKLIEIIALRLSSFNVEIIESAISVCTEKIAISFCSTASGAFLLIALFAIIFFAKRKNQEKLHLCAEDSVADNPILQGNDENDSADETSVDNN